MNSHFDGAFLAGFSATNGVWRVDADGMWAAVGGDRVPEVPNLSVDLDVIYGHGSVGRRIAPDFFVTGGIRRIAVKYDVTFGTRAPFEQQARRVGSARRRRMASRAQACRLARRVRGRRIRRRQRRRSQRDVQGGLEADDRTSAFTGGYSWLYFKVSQDVANQTFVAKQTLSGPIIGIRLLLLAVTRSASTDALRRSPPIPRRRPRRSAGWRSRARRRRRRCPARSSRTSAGRARVPSPPSSRRRRSG